MTLKNSLRIRQDILNKIKNQVRQYLGPESRGLRRYALAYKNDIERTRWSVSSEEELLATLQKADVIFGGDFHGFSQAQRVHLRQLRRIAPLRPVQLALECFYSKDQKWLDAYMRNEVTEVEFLKKIQWDQHWGFAWEQYRPLIDWAKQCGWSCVAINKRTSSKSMTSLQARDQHAVNLINKILVNKKKETLVYVIYGDLHIAQEHLPSMTQKETKNKFHVVTLYLNPEKIYFQLMKQGLDQPGLLLRFTKNQFCLVESPPWVKWQSYLLQLEQSLDHLLEEEDRHFNYQETIQSLLQLLAADFNTLVPEVHSILSFDEEPILEVFDGCIKNGHKKFLQEILESDVSFYWAAKKIGYLSRGTVNYASHLAGIIFHAEMSKRRGLLWEFPDCFEAQIWMEAIAFFLSKVVNPHRKAIRMDDIKKQLAAFSSNDGGVEPLKIALDQKMYELVAKYGSRERNQRKNIKNKVSFLKAAQILGVMLGEKIFSQHRTGRLSRLQLQEWLCFQLEHKTFNNFYYERIKELDSMELGEINAGRQKTGS